MAVASLQVASLTNNVSNGRFLREEDDEREGLNKTHMYMRVK